jgi:putative copper export protein
VVSGATGHSAAIGAPWAAPAKALHLAGSAAWLGGLAWLLSLDRTDRVRFTRETSRVSSVALTSVVAVALSGVLQAVLFTPSLRELAASPYGAVLGAKILGLLVLVAFGARHRFRMMPKVHADAASLDGFRTSIAREVLVMAVVFLVGGLLAYVPVPAEPTMTPTTHAQGQ